MTGAKSQASGLRIDLSRYGGPVLMGREKGARIRGQLALDRADVEAVHVVVMVPDRTLSINSSFFLGLFGPSIRKAGSKDAFLRKFEFRAPPHIKNNVVDKNIERALFENQHLFLNKKSGLG